MLVVALLLALPLGASEMPVMHIEAPPSLEGVARRIAAIPPEHFLPSIRMTGATDLSTPIRLVVAPEDSDVARNTPPWIAGFADGLASAIVVFPARSAHYPDDDLEEVVIHEVTHILVWRAAGSRPVPRWFNEGLAVTAGRSWTLRDRGFLMAAGITRDPVSLDEIEHAFYQGEGPASRAYALSSAFVRDLLQRYGPRFPALLFDRMSAGDEFETAFRKATGDSLDHAQTLFWRHQSLWNRWLPFATSSLALWIVITLLALWAFRRRRVRDAAIRQQWDDEEELRILLAKRPPPPPDEQEWIH